MKKLMVATGLVAWTTLAFVGGWIARPSVQALQSKVMIAVAPVLPPDLAPATGAANADVSEPTVSVTVSSTHPLFVVSTPNPAYSARTANAHPLLDEAWSKVRESFVGELPNDQQRDAAAIQGALALLGDKYTIYLPPANRAAEREHYAGKFGGIGVNIVLLKDGRSQLSPIKNTPAERGGIVKGDILVSVDEWMVPTGIDFNAIAARVRGEPGTTVHIGVLRGNETLKFTLVREQITTASVEWRMITETEKTRLPVGYMQLSSFTERTGIEARQAISEMQAAGAQAWLLDLRDNGGGLLSSASEVASQFLSDGNVLIESKRTGENSWPVTKGGLLANSSQPLIVLVNSRTASASEIVAAALQDDKRGLIVGEPTFGKGVVQLLYDLSDGSSVHVTSARWYSPNRRTIDGVGVLPDIAVAQTQTDSGSIIDQQLDRALRELNSK